MANYEVRIGYRGVNVYYVDASDQAAAEKIAEMRYSAGDNGEEDGTTWEQIDSISSMAVDAAEESEETQPSDDAPSWPPEDIAAGV